jgi:hypothetical protein
LAQLRDIRRTRGSDLVHNDRCGGASQGEGLRDRSLRRQRRREICHYGITRTDHIDFTSDREARVMMNLATTGGAEHAILGQRDESQACQLWLRGV